MKKIVDKLRKECFLEKEEFIDLIQKRNDDCFEYMSSLARIEREKVFGKKVYIRGLIEFTNYCKNDCFYCGIRKSNKNAVRYRLNEEDILECCKQGYELGFRTFVLQGGEDFYYSDELLCHIVENIKKINKTNLNYIEPHRIIIKGITFLAFNYSNEIFVENLYKRIKLSDLETYIKQIN